MGLKGNNGRHFSLRGERVLLCDRTLLERPSSISGLWVEYRLKQFVWVAHQAATHSQPPSSAMLTATYRHFQVSWTSNGQWVVDSRSEHMLYHCAVWTGGDSLSVRIAVTYVLICNRLLPYYDALFCWTRFYFRAKGLILMNSTRRGCMRKVTWTVVKTSSPYRAVNTLRLGYKNQSVNVV